MCLIVVSVLHSRKCSCSAQCGWSTLTQATTVGQQRESLTLYELLFTGRHLLRDSPITSLKSNLCTALTPQNTRENKCIVSHCALVQFTFKWNTSFSGHKRRTVAFSQSKPLPIPIANSTVSMCQGVACATAMGLRQENFPYIV